MTGPAAAVPLSPRAVADQDELRAWRERRADIDVRVRSLVAQGACYQCEDLRTGGEVLGDQPIVLDNARTKVVLALDPRVPGHTIVVWKRHVQDVLELDADEVAELFQLCQRVGAALRGALLGVERVYLVTMCDGDVNHLHVQLIPRYAGTPIGSARLVDSRGPILDGELVAAAIRSALIPA